MALGAFMSTCYDEACREVVVLQVAADISGK